MSKIATLEVEVITDIKNLSSGLDKAAATTTKFSSQVGRSMGEVGKSSDMAGNALMNLGRIAQDAPFGFIGITNNINPMLESFQRLKAETGSTGSALKALAGGLMGGAGLGLAVSVVTGLLTVLAQNGFFRTKKAADEAAESAKKYKDTVNGIFSETGKEAASVVSLIAVLKSETETRGRKLAVLEQLKKINPEIFNGLKLEHGAVSGLDEAYKKYIENLKVIVAAKITQAKLETKLTQLIEAQGIAGNKLQSNLTKGFEDGLRQQKAYLQSIGATPSVIAQIDTQIQQLTEPNKRKIELLNSEIQSLTKDLIEFSKGIKAEPLKPIKVKAEVEKPDKTQWDKIKKLYENFLRNEKIEVPIEPVIFKSDVSGKDMADAMQGWVKYVESQLNRYKIRFNPFDTIEVKEGLLKSYESNILEGLKNINKIFSDFQFTAIETFADNIGKTMANGANPFSDFFSLIGTGLQAIGKELLKMAGLAQLVKASLKSIFTNPAAALSAGIAAIALGSFIKNKASKGIPGFAGGVENFAGGWAVVGERGPELMRLPRGASITPNNMMPYTGSGQMVFIPSTIIKGSDLHIVYNRASKTLSRQG